MHRLSLSNDYYEVRACWLWHCVVCVCSDLLVAAFAVAVVVLIMDMVVVDVAVRHVFPPEIRHTPEE